MCVLRAINVDLTAAVPPGVQLVFPECGVMQQWNYYPGYPSQCVANQHHWLGAGPQQWAAFIPQFGGQRWQHYGPTGMPSLGGAQWQPQGEAAGGSKESQKAVPASHPQVEKTRRRH